LVERRIPVKKTKRITTVFFVLVLVVLTAISQVGAASVSATMTAGMRKVTSKRITLTQAKALGLKNSTEYVSLESKYALAIVKYTQSVKSLKEKKRDKTTFRWSPLIKLKFPQSLTFTEEFDYIYKPMELQSDIQSVKHQMATLKYSVYEKVSNLYIKIYSLQEQIAFEKERLETLQANLEKNQVRLAMGDANQADVDKIQSTIDSVTQKLTSDETNFETNKEKLYNLIDNIPTIIYMTAIRSAIKAIDVTQSRVLFSFSLIANSI